MTFTYDASLATDLARIRREIGDTVTADALLTDEEIAYAILDEDSVLEAAARCCEWIARTFARDFNFQADGSTVEKGRRAEHYLKLAAELRERAQTADSRGMGVLQTVNVDGYQPTTLVDHHDRVLFDPT